MQRRGVSRTVKVPQIEFIAPFEDIPVAQQRRVRTVQTVQLFMQGYGGDEGVSWPFEAIFRPPPGRLELSASFWSPRGEEFFAIEGSLAQFIGLC